MQTQTRHLAAIAIAAFLSVPAVSALATGQEATRGSPSLDEHERSADLVPALEALAEWCHDRRLYGRRDCVYASILRLDPSHREALRYLKYRLVRGEWVQNDRYRLPKDYDARALGEYAERVKVVAQVVRIQAQDTDARAQRERLWRVILALIPDDVEARAAIGEVAWTSSKGERLWIHRDTAASLERRTERRLRVEEVLSGEGEAAARGNEEAVRTPEVELGNHLALEAEAIECARLLMAAEMLLTDALHGRAGLPRDLKVVLIGGGAKARERHLDSISDLTDEERERALEFASWWLPATRELILWADEAVQRREHAVMQAVTIQLFDHYGRDGIDTSVGWAIEGLTLYVSRELLGRPHPYLARWHASGRASSPKFEEDLRVTSLEALASGGSDSQEFFSKRCEEMKKSDLLVAEALVCYLAECDPESLRNLLASAAKRPADETLRDVLDCSERELWRRVLRWHREHARIAELQAS